MPTLAIFIEFNPLFNYFCNIGLLQENMNLFKPFSYYSTTNFLALFADRRLRLSFVQIISQHLKPSGNRHLRIHFSFKFKRDVSLIAAIS